jgi:hypothetical protein
MLEWTRSVAGLAGSNGRTLAGYLTASEGLVGMRQLVSLTRRTVVRVTQTQDS